MHKLTQALLENFQADGYVIIADFLDDRELAVLRQVQFRLWHFYVGLCPTIIDAPT